MRVRFVVAIAIIVVRVIAVKAVGASSQPLLDDNGDVLVNGA
jgi:hypothetical protein